MAYPPPHFPARGAVILGGPGQAAAAGHLGNGRPARWVDRSRPGFPIPAACAGRGCLDCVPALRLRDERGWTRPQPGDCGDAGAIGGPGGQVVLPGLRQDRGMRRLAVQGRGGACGGRRGSADTTAARLLPVFAPLCTGPAGSGPAGSVGHSAARQSCRRSAPALLRGSCGTASSRAGRRESTLAQAVRPLGWQSARGRCITRRPGAGRPSRWRKTRGIRAFGRLVRGAGEGVHGA